MIGKISFSVTNSVFLALTIGKHPCIRLLDRNSLTSKVKHLNTHTRFGALHSERNPMLQTRAKMSKENVKKRAITISVDGNISSGKSTLVSNLQKLFPEDFDMAVDIIPEPLEKWTNLKGNNLLEMFYENPVQHNFMFQHYVQLTRLVETIKKPSEVRGENVKNEQRPTARIMERSLQNNRHCFIELARREGRLQAPEFAVLAEWHDWMEKHFDLDLDLIIYLRTSPETVFKRMQGRGREEEASVPFEYLKNLHETYEDWLIRENCGSGINTSEQYFPTSTSSLVLSKINGHSNQKIIVIDANRNKEEVATECSNCLKSFMAVVNLNSTSKQ